MNNITHHNDDESSFVTEEDRLAAFAVTRQARYRDQRSVHHVNAGDRRTQFFVREACKATTTSKKPAFWLQIDDRQHGRTSVQVRRAGRALIDAARANFWEARMEFPRYVFSPEFLLCEKMFSALPPHTLDRLFGTMSKKDILWIVKRANRFVSTLKRRLCSRKFQDSMRTFRRNARENFKGLILGLDLLASVHETVQVLFFTFSPYTSEALLLDREGVEKIDFESGDPEGLHRFMAQRDMFQKAMTAKFGKQRLGYAWTLEHGSKRRYHIHYLLVLHKDWPMNDLTTADWVGRKWLQVTGQQGEFYCSNAFKKLQAFLAVGDVCLSEPNVITGLQYIAAYMTLGGLFMKLDAGSYDTYGRGGFKGGKSNAAGRPRTRRSGPDIRISARDAERRITFF